MSATSWRLASDSQCYAKVYAMRRRRLVLGSHSISGRVASPCYGNVAENLVQRITGEGAQQDREFHEEATSLAGPGCWPGGWRAALERRPAPGLSTAHAPGGQIIDVHTGVPEETRSARPALIESRPRSRTPLHLPGTAAPARVHRANRRATR